MSDETLKHLKPDCEHCFGLCCVALPYAKSADFPFDKDSGSPCRNLLPNFRCSIHKDLKKKGFHGCVAYECFGAGQKVSQVIYEGNDWRSAPEHAKEMFNVFPVIQQLHEMLWYLHEALNLEASKPIHKELQTIYAETEDLTKQSPEFILNINVHEHRSKVNELLLRTSELVRAKELSKTFKKKIKYDLIGAKLKGTDLKGTSLRGVLLIAADLRDADLRMTDLIGADLRDADLSGANLTGSIFLTQSQVNAAKGDRNTILPPTLKTPSHWK